MRSRHIRGPRTPWLLLGLGIVCVLAGGVWRFVLPDATRWTDEQAKAFQRAGVGVHDAMHADSDGHGHHLHDHHGHDVHRSHSEPPPLDVGTALRKYDAFRVELEQAQARRIGLPAVFLVLGVVLIVVGGGWSLLSLESTWS